MQLLAVVMKAAAKPEAILALWVSLSCVSFMDHACILQYTHQANIIKPGLVPNS
jgi:hypothetical protein